MDIVKRLRLDRPCISDVDCCGDICIEAADEIEQLRDVLEDLMAVQNGPPLTEFQSEWMDAMIRASDMLYKRTERKGDRGQK